MSSGSLPYGRYDKKWSGGGPGGFNHRGEHRRIKRIGERQQKKVCFNCREPGHLVADCPQGQKSQVAVGICFKCGSSEHSLNQCRLKTKDLPFAECFVCGAMGHLSRNCTENANGCYPSGGACLICDSKSHLASECPRRAPEIEAPEVSLPTLNQQVQLSADQEVDMTTVKPNGKIRRPKVVKF